MKRFLCLFVFIFLFSFKYPDPLRGRLPTSTNPSIISLTTHTPLSFLFKLNGFKGFPDSKVIGFNLPDDTVVADFFQEQMGTLGPPPGYKTGAYYPGTVWVSDNKLLDEVEVSNLDWMEFVSSTRLIQSDEQAQKMMPNLKTLPVENYYRSPFYRYFPVVGITYEQVLEYCRWRTEVVNKKFVEDQRSGKLKTSKKVRLIYRLPSEKEWETYAACGINLKKYPLGFKYPFAEIEVNPKAGKYLKFAGQLEQVEDKIKEDIKVYNKSHPKVPLFRVKYSDLPYFLQAKSPSYIFNLPINNYGLYNMIGNVSEMVMEKGISKGGSYNTSLENCAIQNKIPYSGASNEIGFRALCEILSAE
ncbi:MAG: SUMF1/EgtB/PvdO family nonheme iron enzyme [Opitutaceae bacterium]|nr:SUMF1/EgtB/PvdO family nonheme iron enzyme [Cytophagales bacterium]